MKNLTIILTFCVCLPIFSQNKISGTITDKLDNSPIPYVNILIENTTIGAATDENGTFTLESDKEFPWQIVISNIGYDTERMTITEASNSIEIKLNQGNLLTEIIVQGASKYNQRFVESPVSIHKLSAKEINNTSSSDVYLSLSNLREVHANNGSMTMPSLNARGFANPNNFRMIQHVDGVDITSPGFGIIGNTMGATQLDLKDIEFIPGASSALYGANAFNGIIRMSTKDPFRYQGLSAEVKTGVATSDANGSQPYNDFVVRFAKALGDKFAIKFDLHSLIAEDWHGNDFSFRIGDTYGEYINRVAALNTDPNSPTFNAVNRYGDGDFGEGIAGNITLADGSETPVFRTGIDDKDVWDGKLKNFNGTLGLYYKFNDDLTLNYKGKYSNSDLAFRITTFYPFEDFQQFVNSLELKGKKFSARLYHSKQSADGYIGYLLASQVQSAIKSNADWLADYQAEYDNSGDFGLARAAADGNIFDADGRLIDTSVLNQIKNNSTSTFVRDGGSGFSDNSGYFNADFDLDLSNRDKKYDLLIGANYRRFSLNSDGSFFNDGEIGFNETINTDLIGGYLNFGLHLLDDHLTVSALARFDNHNDFGSAFSPRASIVWSIDEMKNHNLRASYMTGFRNPNSQEGYLNFDLNPVVKIVGNAKSSAEAMNYVGGFDGVTRNLADVLYDNFGLNPLENEKIQTWEFGYKSLISNRLLIDVNFYTSKIRNYVSLGTFVDPPNAGHILLTYINATDDQVLNSVGGGISLDYAINSKIKAYANYQYTDISVGEYENDPSTNSAYGVDPTVDSQQVAEDKFLNSVDFNTPKHKFNIGITGSKLGNKENLGFNIAWKSTSEFFYKSAFGRTDIPSYNNTDASISYRVPSWNSVLKLGGSNIFKQEYTHVYGGPQIGSIYYLSWKLDLGN